MKNVRLDFNYKIINALGNEVGVNEDQKLNAARLLANFLETSVKDDEPKIIKYYQWSRQLATSGILELDHGDVIELKSFIEKHQGIFVVVKAPLLITISEAKEAGK